MDMKSELINNIQNGNYEKVSEIIKNLDPNFLTSSVQSPLHFASLKQTFNSGKLVELLINNHISADHTIRDGIGWTPVHYAIYTENFDVLEIYDKHDILIDNDIDFAQKNKPSVMEYLNSKILQKNNIECEICKTNFRSLKTRICKICDDIFVECSKCRKKIIPKKSLFQICDKCQYKIKNNKIKNNKFKNDRCYYCGYGSCNTDIFKCISCEHDFCGIHINHNHNKITYYKKCNWGTCTNPSIINGRCIYHGNRVMFGG